MWAKQLRWSSAHNSEMSSQSDERIRVYLIAKTRALSYARIRGQDATRKRRVADKGKPKTGKRSSFLGAHLDLIFCVDFPQCLAYCYPRRLRRNTRGNQSKVPVSVLSITPADLSILGFSGFGTIAVRIYSSNCLFTIMEEPLQEGR